MPSLDAARHRFAALVERLGAVPLGWAGSTATNYHANLGDALSAIVVAAVSGRRILRRGFAAPCERMAAVGTIAHGFHQGTVHIWGSGMSGVKSPGRPDAGCYQAPADTLFHVHATRGPFTARLLAGQGIPVSGIYGDPVFLFPRFFHPAVVKRHELGVIFHISERKERHPQAPPLDHYRRYRVGPSDADAVRILNTYCEPDLDGLRSRMLDLLSCKRIVSTSLHGCIIAEAYRIPWLYFRTTGQGAHRLDLENDDSLDLRYRDAFTAIGLPSLPAYGQELERETDWVEVIAAVDRLWCPSDWKADELLASFPLPIDRHMVSGQVSDLFTERGFRDRLSDFQLQQFSSGAVPDSELAPVTCPAPSLSAIGTNGSRLTGHRDPAVPRVVGFASVCGRSQVVSMVWADCHDGRIAIADGLVPCIVSALAGMPVVRRAAIGQTVRLVSAGVPINALGGGSVHLWGAGVADNTASAQAKMAKFHLYAVCGPLSRSAMAPIKTGLAIGDPRWLLPVLHPRPNRRSCDLGVVVERWRLDFDGGRLRPAVGQRFLIVPSAWREKIHLLVDDAPARVKSLLAGLDALLTCSRIATTSWPIMAIAQAYGIPCILLVAGKPGNPELDVRTDTTLPIGLRDLVLAAGLERLCIACRDPARGMRWDRLIQKLNDLPSHPNIDSGSLRNAFPLTIAGHDLKTAVVRGW